MNDTCQFCGGENACYQRRDDNGKWQDACFLCASKPYGKRTDSLSHQPPTPAVQSLLEALDAE